MSEFMNRWKKATPGKYWKLPKNKEALLPQYLKDPNYLAMVKYDGYWARAIIGEDDVKIQSRGISKVTGEYGDYTPLVPHIVEELKRAYPPGTIVIGEVCYPNDLSKKATDVGRIMRCKGPEAVRRQQDDEKKIYFKAFDMLEIGFVNISEEEFGYRFERLCDETSTNNYVSPAQFSPYATELLASVWDAGGEGIILVHKHLPYNIGGAKAWHSIKVKRKLGDLEGKVVGVLEPTRVYAGDQGEDWLYWVAVDEDGTEFNLDSRIGERGLGKLINVPVTKPYYYKWKSGVVVEYKGRTIKMSSGTTDDDGAYLATDAAKKLIEEGSLYAVFTGMEMTPDSVRHPNLIRLRDDM